MGTHTNALITAPVNCSLLLFISQQCCILKSDYFSVYMLPELLFVVGCFILFCSF